jgi:hypothetical protein
VCASGVCTDSTCAGSLSGHIISIGHDYRSFHAAIARVLGNSVALGTDFNIGIARFVAVVDHSFVASGGVVVVEGAGGVSYRFATGTSPAHLGDISGRAAVDDRNDHRRPVGFHITRPWPPL